MLQRTFSFDRPLWNKPRHFRPGVGSLLSATFLWLALYFWLGWSLWQDGISFARPVQMGLLAACVVLGVLIVLGWRGLGMRLFRRLRRGGWRPMSLDALQEMDPSDFEAYVAERVFARRGYRVENTRDTKDGGIDVLVTDRFGLQAVVQCKRYRGTVGEAVVRDLYGTMIHAGATYAYLVTSGQISDDAFKWANGKPIELIDGPRLVELSKND
ncbi:MAG: restriction endonuclease [Caldilineaceae bacterium]|nr:restriction endonuclease [Caldilineaceae bacterium]